MKHTALLAVFISALVSISGCASVAPPRAEYTNIPPLEKGWSRIFIAAGQLKGVINVDLKLRTNTGPVYINGQRVGSTAYKEYFAVDFLPGSYEANWVPDEPDKFYSEKKAITLRAGEIRYFTCDLEPKGMGWGFGLIGAALSDYMWRGWLNERHSFDSKSKLVSYLKFNGASNSNPPESVVKHLNPEVAPANMPTNE